MNKACYNGNVDQFFLMFLVYKLTQRNVNSPYKMKNFFVRITKQGPRLTAPKLVLKVDGVCTSQRIANTLFIRIILRIQDTLKENSDTVHFCMSQDKYPKGVYQDYTNDVRNIISTSLNFAQIRKNCPKRPKLQFLESAQPAPKRDWNYIKLVQLKEQTVGSRQAMLHFDIQKITPSGAA